MLDISIDGLQEIQNRLSRINQRAGNLRPLLLEIGEDLVESTKRRFENSTDPEGIQWQENSLTTLMRYIYRGQDDVDNRTFFTRWASKKPLIDGGSLMRSIHYQLSSDGYGVEIGTDKVQAAMMQFGGTKAEFSHLWGDIPARPYLGLSAADGRRILELSEAYLFD